MTGLKIIMMSGVQDGPGRVLGRAQPGPGKVLGARVLAESGDDPDRYADARSRKNYAGTSPVTRAPGKKKAVLARFVRNRHLAGAVAGVVRPRE